MSDKPLLSAKPAIIERLRRQLAWAETSPERRLPFGTMLNESETREVLATVDAERARADALQKDNADWERNFNNLRESALDTDSLLREAEARADAAEKRLAELEPFEPQLLGMEMNEAGFEGRAKLARGTMEAIVQAFREMNGAANYTETEFKLADGGLGESWFVTVQTPGKPTPHQLRREAEAERDELRATLRSLLSPLTLIYTRANSIRNWHKDPNAKVEEWANEILEKRDAAHTLIVEATASPESEVQGGN